MSETRIKRLSEIFDADYYENGIKTKKSNYKDYSWARLGGEFARTAAHIQKHFTPSSVLDVGCAKGFLVKALRDLGIEAYGVDASEYAVANAHPDIKEFITLGLAEALTHGDSSFDVVTCFDTLEYLTPRDVPRAIKNLLAIAKRYVILCIPTKKAPGDLDASHNTIRPRQWWVERFEKYGGVVEPSGKYFDSRVWWFNIEDFLFVVRKEQ